jgi:UbiD family decarboxylase
MLDATKRQKYNAYDGPHADLREFLARIEAAGELLHIPGAHWDLEIGTLAEIVSHTKPEPPAMLFADVPGYPRGMRLLSGATNSSKRLAITLGAEHPARPGARLSRPHEIACSAAAPCRGEGRRHREYRP